MLHRLSRWPATAAVAAVILVLSSIPETSLPPAPSIPFLDKYAHIIEYALLGFLFIRSVWTWLYPSPKRAVIIAASAFALGVLFGAADEWHQGFCGRTPDPADLAADAVGLIIGFIVYFVLRRSWLSGE